jgi:DNA-directed RNA polymerase subunit M/transcription elongation factor TFIIS
MSTTVEETVKYLDLKNKDIDLKAKILDLLKKLYSRTSEKGELLSMITMPGNISADEILLFLLKASKSENIDNYIRTQNPKILKIQMMNERQYNFIKNPYQDTEGTYMCPKCKGFKTYTQTKQTRSADEGSTTFVICLGCGTSSKL